ncbi:MULTISPECIES: RNA polymerase sigma factor [Robiginitalea]|uniref:RNA polymerase sigma factor n=1 Tax=Robiginitalea TaxID=252306 RepID=UPI0023491C41|nr:MULTISPECIES: RNA polymerase sigma factor [unclassified Robiginitalea]MDC6354561.1 RNA polymerase sigma factor [Robiginitalea sp. PM2]MDC6374757.1 RNA polymerase sigma factor [Robiginitalea sp. SP8]
MKIIALFQNEKALIRKARDGHREAQKTLYEHWSPKMLAVCRRYVRDLQHAEDVMIEGFVKVFENLATYRHEGSFEGWMRRIMVRQSIDFLRKRQFLVLQEELPEPASKPDRESDFLELRQIYELIDALPEGYRTVFVLYVVEGYKHPEIAELLDISESTSKSQLYKARKLLQEQLEKHQITRYGTR